MEWKQAYDSGELENSVLIYGRIEDLSALPPIRFFYTQHEASTAALAIKWPKKSARAIALPLGRKRWAISDEHCRVLTIAGYDRLIAEESRG